ncbi:MAG TPA: diacylglycerol kinase family protein [Polyangiaceae bacterium]|nr:diacylglycerol kinase family protein [Polyangiaceae bacterium]
MRVSVVINPRAGAGSAARQLPALRKGLNELGIEHEILETQRPGHATSLAIGAIERGCTQLAVVGGDGTLNEVSQAYIAADGTPRPGPPLALLPCGTGGDFPRSCEFRQGGIAGGLARLAAGRQRPLDLGVITLHDINARVIHRAFLNVASVGISGEVDERVERGPKWLGGKAAFLLGTVSAALVYQNVPVAIEIDGNPWHEGPMLITAIANGRFLGGGMHIAPEASFSDGLLDVVCVGDLSRAKFLSLFPRVYKGAHLELNVVRALRGRTVSVRPLRGDKPILVDVDGETPGYLPLSARIFPGALQLSSD